MLVPVDENLARRDMENRMGPDKWGSLGPEGRAAQVVKWKELGKNIAKWKRWYEGQEAEEREQQEAEREQQEEAHRAEVEGLQAQVDEFTSSAEPSSPTRPAASPLASLGPRPGKPYANLVHELIQEDPLRIQEADPLRVPWKKIVAQVQAHHDALPPDEREGEVPTDNELRLAYNRAAKAGHWPELSPLANLEYDEYLRTYLLRQPKGTTDWMGAIRFIQEQPAKEGQSEGRGDELRRDQVRKHVERSAELRTIWDSEPEEFVVVEEPKKERVVRPLLKKPKHQLPRPGMPPLKQPKPEIIVPQWVEDAVREAIDRDGDIYRDRRRADDLATQIGAPEEVVRRAVRHRYDEMDQ
jgi:hypothetical protein